MRTIVDAQRLSFILLLALLWCAGALTAQAQSDEELALQYTPAAVAAEVAGSDIIDAQVQVSVARADLDGTGTADYLVAAYAGEESGALRILKLTPSVAVVAESAQSLGGNGVSLRLPDVEGDGIPEIAVAFSQLQGPNVTWVYRWTAGALHPMMAQGVRGCTLIDADGDGILEAVASGIAGAPVGDDPSTSVTRIPVYKVDAGSFVRTDDLFYFALAIAQISPVEAEFAVPDPSAAYVLRVTNGDQAGAHRVVSGEVRLNGTVIVNDGDLAGTDRVIDIGPTLQKTNTISIDVDGPAGGRMIVSVAFAAPYTPPPVAPLSPCVWDEGEGLFTASFGFENPGQEEAFVAAGAANTFLAGPADRGQPERFLPGVHAHEFLVQSNGETLTWRLNGVDAVASLESQRCAGAPPVERTHAANCTPGEPATPDHNEIVWIDDDVPSGAGPLPWSTAESTSGTRSIHVAQAAGSHAVSSVGATQPVLVRRGDRLVFYVLASACFPPGELQVRWHDAAGGWHGAWWGEPLLHDEGSLAERGALPGPGDWKRLEVEADAIASGEFSIDGLEIRLFDGEAWFDRFAIVPAPPSVTSLTMPSGVSGGDSVDASITLSSPAPGDGTIVTFSSDSSVVVPPEVVFVPAGATSASFKVFTRVASEATTAIVTASCNGEATASLIVSGQPLHTLVIEPDTVAGGESTEGTVRLALRAVADTVVTLTSSDPEVATVPPSVVIEAGSFSQTFPIETSSSISAPVSVTITGTGNGVSRSATLAVTPCELYSFWQPYMPWTDRVWISDELPEGASFLNNGSATSVQWNSSQAADGTQSIGTAYGGELNYSFIIQGLSQPVAIGENVVVYVLVNPCAPPRELFIRWHNTASGYMDTYWGTPVLGGESSAFNMGPLPEPTDGWFRIEIPAALLRMEQAVITRLDISYAGGQMWFDHFAISGDACIPYPADQPEIPAGDTVWIGDTLPAGASFQNNGSATTVHWDASQSADGTQSIVSGYIGNDVNYSYIINGLSQPVAIGESVVAYVLVNPCAPPRELIIRWHNTASGYMDTYWGDPELGGEANAINMGPMPEGDGEWVRMEIPASMLRMEQGVVTRIDVNYAGGQVWIDRFGKTGTACIPAPVAQPQIPAGDTVWIGDALPAGASFQNNGSATTVHWDASQSADGTQSIVSGYIGNDVHYSYMINGLSQPVAIGESVVAYVLVNPCAPPRELIIRWHNTASGYMDTYWGAPELGGEANAIDMGPIPSAANGWTRVEIPASLLRMEQGVVTRLDVNYAGGQVWIDRFGKTGSVCIPAQPDQPEIPAGDTVWIGDALPAGASFQNNGSATTVHWDPSQSADGTQSIVSGYIGDDVHYSYMINGLSQPVAIGESVVAYVLVNSCAPPRELIIRWFNTASGYMDTYWGTPELGGEANAINMGPIPSAANGWTRVEIPASLLRMEQGVVTRIDVNYAGGQVWIDRFGKTGTACIPAPVAQPQIPAGDTVWIGDALPAGASFQNNGSATTVHWDASQSADGTQSIVSGYIGNDVHYSYMINGLSQPVAIGESVVAYVLVNSCAPPRELIIRWHNTASGYMDTYWGTPELGGEANAINMGPIPSAANGWTRVEIPASLLRMEQGVVTRIDVNYAGGQVWIDRIGKTGTPCIPAPSAQPQIPAGDTVWIGDALPAGASFQNNGSATTVHWDPSQSADGTQSIVSGYIGNDVHYSYMINGLSQPVAIGDNIVLYVRSNECAPPRELLIRWHNTVSGYTQTYWGTPELGGESGSINMGAMPAATGEWIRLELPASLLQMQQSVVTRVDINYAGGQMWFDHFGKTAAP